MAQTIDQTLADVAQAQSVNARSKSNYDPAGIAVGASRLVLTAAGKMLYDDNVYDTDTMHASDVEAVVAPRAELRTKSANYAVTLAADASIERYARLTAENTDQYDLTATGRWQIAAAIALGATGFIGRHHELRGTLGDIVVGAPSRYDTRGGTADLAVAIGSLVLDAGGGAQTLKYLPVELAGQSLDQSTRNRTSYTANATISVALSPGLRTYLRGDYNAQDYARSGPSIDQNSHGFAVTTGLALGVDELISGQIDIAYLQQKYSDAALRTVGGLTYDARITWNPTPLLTATLTGGRSLQQSPFFAQDGVIEDSVALQIDYELLRNLIVSVAQHLTFDDFRGTDRIDRRYNADVWLRYLVSRRLELGLQLDHRDQQSRGLGARPYVGNSVMISAIVKR